MSDREAVRKIEEMCSEANWRETGCRITKAMCDHVARSGRLSRFHRRKPRWQAMGKMGSYIDLFRLKLLLSCQQVLRKLKAQPFAEKE